ESPALLEPRLFSTAASRADKVRPRYCEYPGPPKGWTGQTFAWGRMRSTAGNAAQTCVPSELVSYKIDEGDDSKQALEQGAPCINSVSLLPSVRSASPCSPNRPMRNMHPSCASPLN